MQMVMEKVSLSEDVGFIGEEHKEEKVDHVVDMEISDEEVEVNEVRFIDLKSLP